MILNSPHSHLSGSLNNLSYIQNSYAFVHSFGTSSIIPYSVVPPSCPALSTTLVVVAIGLAGSVPIGRSDMYSAVWSDQGPVGVVVRFRVQSFGSEFWVEVWLELGGFTQVLGSDGHSFCVQEAPDRFLLYYYFIYGYSYHAISSGRPPAPPHSGPATNPLH